MKITVQRVLGTRRHVAAKIRNRDKSVSQISIVSKQPRRHRERTIPTNGKMGEVASHSFSRIFSDLWWLSLIPYFSLCIPSRKALFAGRFATFTLPLPPPTPSPRKESQENDAPPLSPSIIITFRDLISFSSSRVYVALFYVFLVPCLYNFANSLLRRRSPKIIIDRTSTRKIPAESLESREKESTARARSIDSISIRESRTVPRSCAKM